MKDDNRVAVRLTPEEKQQLKVRIAQDGITHQDVLYRAVQDYLGNKYTAPEKVEMPAHDILRSIRHNAEQIIDACTVVERGSAQTNEGAGRGGAEQLKRVAGQGESRGKTKRATS